MTQYNAKNYVFLQKGMLAFCIFLLLFFSTQLMLLRFNEVSDSFNSSLIDTNSLVVSSLEDFTQVKYAQTAGLDPVLHFYRSEISQKAVKDFFSEITGNEHISSLILEYAHENNIAPSLAFALSWEESRYQIFAVNKNANSIDRGLFQLNNRAFPSLTEKDFFNPETNVRHGIRHLRYCIDLSGNEITALAMYNAGATKVRNDNTPKRTLDYVSRILNYKINLENQFYQTVITQYLDEQHNSKVIAKVFQ